MIRFCVIILLFISTCVHALDLSTIEGGQIITTEEILFFEDTTNSLNLSDVIRSDRFDSQKEIPSVSNVNATYWIKLNFQSDISRKWVLEVMSPHTEYLSIFRKKDGRYFETETGHLQALVTREYQHKNFVFDLYPEHGSTVYLKIKSSNKVGFLFKIQTQQFFSEYSQSEYWYLGAYYGMLIILILYHLVFFFYLRKPVYIFYCVTVLLAGLTSLSDDGFGIMYIWQDYTGLSQSLGLYYLPVLFIVAFSCYAYFFLGNRFRAFQKLIAYCLLGFLIAFFIQLIFSEEKVYFNRFYSLPFILYYLIFLYISIRYKHKPSMFFTIGFSFSLFGIVMTQLRLLNVIEGNILTVYAFNVGVVLEFLSLALSMAYKVKDEAQQKKKAQEKQLILLQQKNESQQELVKLTAEKERITKEINKSLEIKVQDRTSQLTDLITKLKSLNYEYDKENWELRRNVKSEKHSNLVQKKLSLKELLELYPTNYKCLEFLSELKWKGVDDYVCHRCGHDKYSVNTKNLSRKCSRCSTTNSVTKDSLFESQKLPLTKLFYITYLWNSSEEFNVKVLSDELNISETSLYKFVAKIKERKSLKVKQKLAVKSWIDLIF